MCSGNFQGKLSQHSTSALRQKQPGALEEQPGGFGAGSTASQVPDGRAGVRGAVRQAGQVWKGLRTVAENLVFTSRGMREGCWALSSRMKCSHLKVNGHCSRNPWVQDSTVVLYSDLF